MVVTNSARAKNGSDGPSIVCRTLEFETADGPSNMAIDHALLNAVDGDPTFAALRTYAWTEPTLSLGYFQAMADAANDDHLCGLPIVRRPSGGGALLHHHELTYALIVPRSHPLARRPSDLYRAVHAAIAGLLTELTGQAAVRRGDVAALPGRPFLCFADHDPEDILLRGTKVVGSAQRRRPAAVLQHGSILLRRSPHAPTLPGIDDLIEHSISRDALRNRLFSTLAGALQLTATPDTLSATERSSALAIRGGIYTSDAWTSRR